MPAYIIEQIEFESPLPIATNVRVRVRKTSDPDIVGSYTVFDEILRVKPLPGNAAVFVNGSDVATPVEIEIEEGFVDTSYTAWITPECENKPGTKRNFVIAVSCFCPTGFAKETTSNLCFKFETEAAVVGSAGYCLAPSTEALYSSVAARIYSYPFNNSYLTTAYPTIGGGVLANIVTDPYWKNLPGNTTDGVMNREGVWLDSDCDGEVDGVVIGTVATFPFTYNNTGIERIVYVGMGGDNTFKLEVNGMVIADTIAAFGQVIVDQAFTIWHLIPVLIRPGQNYFNAIAVSGGVVDALAMVVYDNSAQDLLDAVSDEELNILFQSSSLKDLTYTIATCAPGWSLDATNGVYTCKRTVYVKCGETQLQITTQPTGGTVSVGGSKQFSVAATGGNDPYTYQWQRFGSGQWEDIDGATSATYTLANAQLADNQSMFRAIVRDASTPMQTEKTIAVTLNVTSSASYAYRIGYADEDPFLGGNTAPGNVVYPAAFSGTITSVDAAITLLNSVAGFANLADKYPVLEMVNAITNRTLVANGGLGPYTIPGQEFSRTATATGKKWIVSNNPWALSLNDSLSFTV